MNWVHDYQLFLFDFDGVLADTEVLHFQAYQKMCANRGLSLKWDHHRYAQSALFSASAVREALYKEFSQLDGIGWDILYKEKKEAYVSLLKEKGAELMPGVEDLLQNLQQAGIPSCVVTNSPLMQVDWIREHNPILKTITHWITREDYSEPKPHPECYHLALKRYAKPTDRVIGFEDSPRGMMALSQTAAEPVLVTTFLSKDQIEALAKKTPKSFTHIPTLSV